MQPADQLVTAVLLPAPSSAVVHDQLAALVAVQHGHGHAAGCLLAVAAGPPAPKGTDSEQYICEGAGTELLQAMRQCLSNVLEC